VCARVTHCVSVYTCVHVRVFVTRACLCVLVMCVCVCVCVCARVCILVQPTSSGTRQRNLVLQLTLCVICFNTVLLFHTQLHAFPVLEPEERALELKQAINTKHTPG